MQILFITLALIAFIALRAAFKHQSKPALLSGGTMLGMGLLISLVWLSLKQPTPEFETPAEPVSYSEYLTQTQDKLRANPNDAEAWFELGQLYIQDNEFGSALTCFDYTLRLAPVPHAGHYAAFATALYYENKQRITPQVQHYLDLALESDPFNETALQLIASDYFIEADYQSAIHTWTKILDSQNLGVNRAKVINNINQAKAMLPRS